MWRDALLPASLTLEMGFSGPAAGPRAGIQNGASSLMDVGLSFGLALHDYLEGPTGARSSLAIDSIMKGGLLAPAKNAKGGGRGNGKSTEPDPVILIFNGVGKKAAAGGDGSGKVEDSVGSVEVNDHA